MPLFIHPIGRVIFMALVVGKNRAVLRPPGKEKYEKLRKSSC